MPWDHPMRSNLPHMATANVPRPDTPRNAVLIVSIDVDGRTLSAREAQDLIHDAADALVEIGGRCVAIHTLPAYREGFDA